MSSIIDINNESIDGSYKINSILNERNIKISGVENFWPNFAGDDFAGTDTDPPDIRVWTEQDANSLLDIRSNALSWNVIQDTGGAATGRIVGDFYFSGDFDIQVDFDITEFSTPPSQTYNPMFFLKDSDGTTIGSISRMKSPTQEKYYALGTDEAGAYAGSADTSGKLRLTRVSGVVNAYYWGGASWTLVSQIIDSDTQDFYPGFYFEQEASGMTRGAIDNFVINSGTVSAR